MIIPLAHRLLRRRAGLAGTGRRTGRDHRRDAGARNGLPSSASSWDSASCSSRSWRLLTAAGMLAQVMHGLSRLRDRAVPADPVRASAPRVPPLRAARPRGARGGEPEVRRPPGGAHRLRVHRLRRRCSGSSTTCSSTAPARGGPTRTCAASARPSGRGCGSSSTGRRGRCCSRWWRGCSGCAAGRAASACGSSWRAVASRARRPWVAAAAVALILTLGGFIFYNTNVLNEYRHRVRHRRSGAPSTSGATGGTRASRSRG